MIEAMFGTLPRETLVDLVETVDHLEKSLKKAGPKTDDELWQWIKNEIGVEVARESVCEGHDAPFDFLAAAYFDRYPAILVMANRGGGKTFLVALLHWINSEFKAGIESATFGATEAQSLRCYSHLKNWIYTEEGDRMASIKGSVMRETNWYNRSKVEVLAGTPEAVNGPHPQVVHGDEVELMREDTWKESRNMAVSKTLPDGTVYPSQELLTSTRKSLHGRMQKLIDGIKEAEDLGMEPSYKLFVWCIFEVAKEMPNCQMAPDDEREARLEELGMDPCDTCECHKQMNGTWPDQTLPNGKPKPRLLSEVCKGRLFRSRGHLPYSDVKQKFKQNSIYTWNAQQECTEPETENNYLRGFSEERNGVFGFVPDPDNGKIYSSVDWGGTNPHAVNWYQRLKFEVAVKDFNGHEIRIPEGSLVCFDEIYTSECGAVALAGMVKKKERFWKMRFPNWKVEDRFADPQGKTQRMDWKDEGLRTTWHTTRDFDEQMDKILPEIYDANLLFYSPERCPMFAAEAMSWQRDPDTGKQIDEFNHAMSNFRYAASNIMALERRLKRRGGGTAPKTTRRRHQTTTVVRDTRRKMSSGPVKIRGGGETDNWRSRLGGPAGNGSPIRRSGF